MKKTLSSFFAVSIFMLFATFNSSASLPELQVAPTPTTMPFTLLTPDPGYDGTTEFIDVNGNGNIDFRVFVTGGTFFISGYNSGNMIHTTIPSFASPENPPLTAPANYAKMLEHGTEIGSGLNSWHSFTRLMQIVMPVSPLTSTLMEVSEGYIGVSYIDNGETYYGWIHVETNPGAYGGSLMSSGPSLTFGGAASAPSPGSSILAGSGGTVVPVSIIASVLGFFAIGTGLYFRRKRKKA